MSNLKIIDVPNGDVVAGVKQAVLQRAMGVGKMKELLHNQLVRKGRVASTSIGNIAPFGNKDISFIRHYDVKSGSKNPYDRDNVDDLGLNQFFANPPQDPYDYYIGEPNENSIYHDTSWIVPKAYKLVGQLSPGFSFTSGGAPIALPYYNIDGKTWYLHGFIDADTIVINEFDYSQNIVHTYNVPIDNDIDPITSLPIPYTGITVLPDYNYILNDTTFVSQYGTLIYGAVGGSDYLTQSVTYVFEHGVAIHIESQSSFGGFIAPSDETELLVYIVPLFYTDTLEPVMGNRLIMEWTDYFDLKVVENSEWWEFFIEPLLVVITIVAAYYLGPTGYEIVSALFAAVGSVGAISGNKFLQAVGIVGSLYTAVLSSFENVMLEEALKQGLTQEAAQQVATQKLLEASFGEVFKGFISNMGLNSAITLANTTLAGYVAMTTSSDQSIQDAQDLDKEEEKTKAHFSDVEEDSYIERILRIGDPISV